MKQTTINDCHILDNTNEIRISTCQNSQDTLKEDFYCIISEQINFSSRICPVCLS